MAEQPKAHGPEPMRRHVRCQGGKPTLGRWTAFGFDPSPTSVVHCGNGFDARFEAHHSGRKHWTDGIVSGFTLASSSSLKNAFL